MANPDGSQDKNLVSLYETDSNKHLSYGVLDGTGDTAPLKITSKAAQLSVSADRLIGGSENCADLNNEVSNVTVMCASIEPRGKYALSAKTSNGVFFTGHIVGRANSWEVNLGSWSDQSKAVQTNTHLSLTADKYPIRVWLGNADYPTLDDPSKYQFLGFGRYGVVVRTFVMFFWGLGKKLGLKI